MTVYTHAYVRLLRKILFKWPMSTPQQNAQAHTHVHACTPLICIYMHVYFTQLCYIHIYTSAILHAYMYTLHTFAHVYTYMHVYCTRLCYINIIIILHMESLVIIDCLERNDILVQSLFEVFTNQYYMTLPQVSCHLVQMTLCTSWAGGVRQHPIVVVLTDVMNMLS